MTLPATATDTDTTADPRESGYDDDFADRTARAVHALRARPGTSAVVHTAVDEGTARLARRGRDRGDRFTLTTMVGGVATAVFGGVFVDTYTGVADTTLAVGSAVLVPSIFVAAFSVGRLFDRRHPMPQGLLLHGHAADAYATVLAGPNRLRELSASERVVGRVEELVPVAEHRATVLAELREQLVADGDPAGDTTGTPAHEQLLTIAGEVTALVENVRATRQVVAAHSHAVLEAGSLVDVDAEVTAEGTVARDALDRLG